MYVYYIYIIRIYPTITNIVQNIFIFKTLTVPSIQTLILIEISLLPLSSACRSLESRITSLYRRGGLKLTTYPQNVVCLISNLQHPHFKCYASQLTQNTLH